MVCMKFFIVLLFPLFSYANSLRLVHEDAKCEHLMSPFAIPLVTSEDMYKWTVTDWEKYSRKSFYMTDDDLTPKLQEVLLMSDFTASEQVVIRDMLRMSKQKKLADEVWLREFAHGLKVSLKEFDDKQKALIFAKKYADFVTKNGVEVGFIRLVLKSGESLVQFMYSPRATAIDNDTYNGALTPIWNSVVRSEVQYMQFFHFHPWLAPLSDGDLGVLGNTKKALVENGINIPVHFYAVADDRDPIIIFHSSK